jgi:UDP-N-acetylmuramate--alanine ligase
VSQAFPPLDLADPTRIHVVGAGGAGMSAIAIVLAAMGHTVTGSDLRASPVIDRLTAAGVDVVVGHRAANVGEAGVVTVSTAIRDDNPEVVEAGRRGIPVYRRSTVLAAIAELRRCIAVAGTHGKTTTASMLALMLVEAGLRPSFLIGGDVNEIGTNAVWDDGEWLVVEADESDGTFLALHPDVAVVTNIEPDHLDHYGSFEAMRSAFGTFLQGARHRVVGGDDARARSLARAQGADTVGVGDACSFRMADLSLSRSSVAFTMTGTDGARLGRLAVPVPGLHNARNAAVATVAALARRFEFRGDAGGVTFVDDYAHLPSEVEAALAAARDGAWRRIVAVFQPHRYSRTAVLSSEFGLAFAQADVVVVTDVYGAGEAPIPGVSGRLVADAVRRAQPDKPVVYVAGRTELRDRVAELLTAGDLCCTLGAGDLTSLPDELLAAPSW